MDQLRQVLELIRKSNEQQLDAELRANRRRRVRVEVETPVRYRLLRWKERDLSHVRGEATGVAHDVSLGGMSLSTNLELPPGLEIEAFFTEPPWESLPPLRGVIVRSENDQDGTTLALQFVAVPGSAKAQLHALLLNQLRGG